MSNLKGMNGADVSQPTTKAQWASWNVEYGVARCFQSTGAVDQAGARSIIAGWEAGLKRMDGYHFPDTSIDAKKQAEDGLGHLVSAGAKIERYWLDVETTSSHAYWGTNVANNQEFVTSWVQAATAFIAANPSLECSGVGIYTQPSYWNTLLGGTTAFAHLPLWWIQVRIPPGVASSLSHWAPFGGWSSPSVVQWEFNDKYDSDWLIGSGQSSAAAQPAAAATAASSSTKATAPVQHRRSAVYVVQPGDTLDRIAEVCRSTVAAIADANGIINPKDLHVGQALTIPPAP